MALQHGNKSISSAYQGNTELSYVYHGSIEVFALIQTYKVYVIEQTNCTVTAPTNTEYNNGDTINAAQTMSLAPTFSGTYYVMVCDYLRIGTQETTPPSSDIANITKWITTTGQTTGAIVHTPVATITVGSNIYVAGCVSKTSLSSAIMTLTVSRGSSSSSANSSVTSSTYISNNLEKAICVAYKVTDARGNVTTQSVPISNSTIATIPSSSASTTNYTNIKGSIKVYASNGTNYDNLYIQCNKQGIRIRIVRSGSSSFANNCTVEIRALYMWGYQSLNI